MRTFSPKASDIQRAWHVVDAEGLVLGRLATEVARLLRGKHKPIFAPHVDTGDHVIVVNADKVVLTSDKAEKKLVYRHSGYPGWPQAAQPTATCWPPSPRRRSAGRSGACCRRDRSAARCSRSSRSTPGPTTPTRPSSRRPLDLEHARQRRRVLRRSEERSLPKPLIQTTGRRKQAVARVRLRPGSGQITVNGRAVDDYFPSETHRMIVTEPLRLTTTAEVYDVDATIDGGGVTGQAGALRLGIARALIELDPELRTALKKAGFLTRDAREKETKKYGLKKARKAPQYSKR